MLFFNLQIGVAAGFVIPPMIVTGGSIDDVTTQLYILFIGVAILTSVILVLILFCKYTIFYKAWFYYQILIG